MNNANNRAIVEAVTTIDVTGKNDPCVADEIGYFTGLKVLNCKGNNIVNLDMSNNPALEVLYCGGLDAYDDDGNYIGYDDLLSSLNISSNYELVDLNCANAKFRSKLLFSGRLDARLHQLKRHQMLLHALFYRWRRI